jgi:hypothetical protein
MNYDIIIIVLLSILLLISTFVSTKGLTDSRYKWLKRIQKRGWNLIIINLLILLLLIGQYFLNDYKSNKKDIKFQKQQELRDEILKRRYDSSLLDIKTRFDTSNIQVITTVSDVLGKYGYRLDSTNKLLKALKDSSKTRVKMPDDPILFCNSIKFHSMDGVTPMYEFSVACKDASSTGFDIKFYVIGQDKTNKYWFIASESFMGIENRMFKNSEEPLLIGIRNDSVYSILYFRLVGTYMNADKTKKYAIDEVCSFRTVNKSFSIEPKYMREYIINFIEQNER